MCVSSMSVSQLITKCLFFSSSPHTSVFKEQTTAERITSPFFYGFTIIFKVYSKKKKSIKYMTSCHTQREDTS